MTPEALLDTLAERRSLPLEGYRSLIEAAETLAPRAAELARKAREPIYGNRVFIRGLIEISSFCKNDCLYCGLRRSNAGAERYRLTEEEIMECADEGYRLGFRTFVLQGGEDAYFTDERLVPLVRGLKTSHPDCAVTLSLGERSRESFAKLREAGADRYLLRHETADGAHYGKLHPVSMSFENRMRCLRDLRELRYQVGCGFMVGSPFQTSETLAKDLKFIEEFRPEMCGIGPFVPHHATPFASCPAGSADLTCYLLSLIRIMHPSILLPATTALGTVAGNGRERGVLAGANVLMPNLSPLSVRKKYELYDNKLCTGEEAAECRACLDRRIRNIGYEIVTDRGDFKSANAVVQ